MGVWRRYYKQKFDLDEKDSIRLIEVNIANRQQNREMHQNKIDIKELKEAIKDIKSAKASREDKVDREMIKHMGKIRIDWLHKIVSEAWEINKIPEEWKDNLMLPIFKKGNRTRCDNHTMPKYASH